MGHLWHWRADCAISMGLRDPASPRLLRPGRSETGFTVSPRVNGGDGTCGKGWKVCRRGLLGALPTVQLYAGTFAGHFMRHAPAGGVCEARQPEGERRCDEGAQEEPGRREVVCGREGREAVRNSGRTRRESPDSRAPATFSQTLSFLNSVQTLPGPHANYIPPPTFTAVVFTTAKIWEEPQFPSVGDGIKLWSVCTTECC